MPGSVYGLSSVRPPIRTIRQTATYWIGSNSAQVDLTFPSAPIGTIVAAISTDGASIGSSYYTSQTGYTWKLIAGWQVGANQGYPMIQWWLGQRTVPYITAGVTASFQFNGTAPFPAGVAYELNGRLRGDSRVQALGWSNGNTFVDAWTQYAEFPKPPSNEQDWWLFHAASLHSGGSGLGTTPPRGMTNLDSALIGSFAGPARALTLTEVGSAITTSGGNNRQWDAIGIWIR